jgi:hypothetical protein
MELKELKKKRPRCRGRFVFYLKIFWANMVR